MKIAAILLRYDYGDKARGESLEARGIYPALEKTGMDIHPFWFDEYLADKESLQKAVINFVDNVKPDYVYFTLIHDEFSFETLDYLKDKYITINWFADDKFRFDSFTRHYAPHFTYSVTTDRFSLRMYKQIDYKNVLLTQWAAFETADASNIDKTEYQYDVSFVGMATGYRKWIIKELSKAGIEVACFGHGWPKGRVSFEQFKNIIKLSRINLNISNSVSYDIRYIVSSIGSFKEFLRCPKRSEDIKARNYEIPALGGFELTNYVLGLEQYFVIGSEIAVYGNIEELTVQINYYLENEDERQKILQCGYNKAVVNNTYYNRLNDIFTAIGKCK